MNRPPKPLYELLLALFRSNDDVYELLINHPYQRSAKLVAALPGTNVPRTTFTLKAVEQIQAHGLDKDLLFERLTEEFPERRDLINAARRSYFQITPELAKQSSDLTNSGDMGPPPTAAMTKTFEKIVGDRPTFLDVSYLALGYKRARSVAMLRMRFQKEWSAGTAFLISPDTLLTAYHNLWLDGERSPLTEVIFDFERADEGPDPIASVHSADPQAFVGDEKHDWALLRLGEPQLDRPLAPLADKAASEGDRVAIIQHPGGMLKQVALHHNLVTYADDSRIKYLTDTLPGSSGSPIFDSQWNVVGVHHLGVEYNVPGKNQTIYWNEGIPIDLIKEGMATLGAKH